MRIIDVQQGSPEWLALRKEYHTASEASIMMGASPYVSRDEFIRREATGDEPEVTPEQQRIFDKGHEAEAKARALAEGILGEEVYPVVGVDDDTCLLASFDGLTLMCDVVWECKQWNKQKAEAVRNGEVPECDRWQVVQQLVVSGAEKCLYMVTDGENEVHTWYRLQPGDREALLLGWKQFEVDVAKWKPEAAKVEAVGAAPDPLPALHIQVRGEVSASNLNEFRERALALIRNVKTELTTDQDFADAEQTVKWCKDVEARLKSAKEAALAQTASIDELFRTMDSISDEARKVRLQLDKLVKERKRQIKEQIYDSAMIELTKHAFSVSPDGIDLKAPAESGARISEAMKGKKTLESLRSAANDEVARIKIEITKRAELARANIETAKQHAGELLSTIMPDLAALAEKPAEDFAALLKARMDAFAEAQAEQAKAQAEQAPAPAQEAAPVQQAAQPEKPRNSYSPARWHQRIEDWAKRNRVSQKATRELLQIISETFEVEVAA